MARFKILEPIGKFLIPFAGEKPNDNKGFLQKLAWRLLIRFPTIGAPRDLKVRLGVGPVTAHGSGLGRKNRNVCGPKEFKKICRNQLDPGLLGGFFFIRFLSVRHKRKSHPGMESQHEYKYRGLQGFLWHRKRSLYLLYQRWNQHQG